MSVLITATAATETNRGLVEAFERQGVPARLQQPRYLLGAGRSDLVLGRVDVHPGLGGPASGVFALVDAAAAGIPIRNGADALLACHDKLLTSVLMDAGGVPHPRTTVVFSAAEQIHVPPPVVVKPRFGSWGRDVVRCETQRELRECLAAAQLRPWFSMHGAIVQELVAPRGHDLRIVVAAGEVVGAIARRAAPGEWRTNVALGATRVPVVPPQEACDLARRAAAVVRGDLVGVDLLPSDDGWTVLELNGAVEFTSTYSLDADVFDETARSLLAHTGSLRMRQAV